MERKNLSLPAFCEFYKFFIVEEIALQRNVEKIHYGKCNVIGYLSSSDCLQSLTIPNIEKWVDWMKFEQWNFKGSNPKI